MQLSIVKHETNNLSVEPTGMGPRLPQEKAEGLVLGQVWNQTDPFLLFKLGPLVGHLTP
jgi:hypothetical protein